MGYKVVRRFREIKHDGHIYEVGDFYPKKGYRSTKKRLEELSSQNNKYKKIYIKQTPDDKE